MTPETQERAIKLLTKSQAMSDAPGRYDYQIGDYWNVCGEMVEFLEELLDIRAGGMAHNPMFDTEIRL